MFRRPPQRFILVSVLALLLLAGCSGQSVAPMPQPPGETYRSSQGLVITSLGVQPDEIAKILEIKRWNFMVTPFDTATKLNYQLELHRSNGEAQVLSSFIIRPDNTKPMDALVAFYPVDGSLFESSRIKLYIESGGGATSKLIDNPFLDFSGFGPTTPAKLQENGEFLLVRLSPTASVGTDQDSRLTFSVRTVE
jgi:hypothetical protein